MPNHTIPARAPAQDKDSGCCSVSIVLAVVAWMNRNWSEEQAVGQFFAALQKKDYEAAYGV